MVGLSALAALDLRRAPRDQLGARAFVAAVRAYQSFGRPVLAGHVRCRYEPTCSVYSIGAVERFGLFEGLKLTARRVSGCTRDVPMGTADPVPSGDVVVGE